MKITVELQPNSWETALRAARNTVWKGATFKEPSDKFKDELCRSEHSPLRCVRYYIHIEGLPFWQSPHWTRHKTGVEWFQSTLRDDRQKEKYDRDSAPQGMLINLDCECNAAELIFMARRRLCGMSHAETRKTMRMILSEVAKKDPIIVKYCVPNCVYRGHCPEAGGGCGYSRTTTFANAVEDYRKTGV